MQPTFQEFNVDDTTSARVVCVVAIRSRWSVGVLFIIYYAFKLILHILHYPRWGALYAMWKYVLPLGALNTTLIQWLQSFSIWIRTGVAVVVVYHSTWLAFDNNNSHRKNKSFSQRANVRAYYFDLKPW